MVDGALNVRVAAPPVDGAANAALVRLVARTLEVPIVQVRLVVGATARRKVIEVAGVEPALLRARWPGLDV